VQEPVRMAAARRALEALEEKGDIPVFPFS
jgi:hypothetical protein